MKVQKLTLSNVEQLKSESDNALVKLVCDYIINEWDDEHESNNKNMLLDIINSGCSNGAVHWFTYKTDILEFYDSFKNEIYELLLETLDTCGCNSPTDLFGDKWNNEDPLAFFEDNKQLLAFFGFEETARNIANEFGIEW